MIPRAKPNLIVFFYQYHDKYLLYQKSNVYLLQGVRASSVSWVHEWSYVLITSQKIDWTLKDRYSMKRYSLVPPTYKRHCPYDPITNYIKKQFGLSGHAIQSALEN